VFVFPGQGVEWLGMGVALLDGSPVFAARLAECDAALRPYTGWSVCEVLRDGGSLLDRVDVVQPALFAVMVSLAALWRSFGVEPAAVVGHSQGEVAAACVAGALSLEDAALVVALRSRLLGETAGRGGMLYVLRPREEVEGLLVGWPSLSVAAVNGESAVTVAGDSDALDGFGVMLADAGVWRWVVPGVDFAAHSPQVDSLRGELRILLSGVCPRVAEVPFYSTVTGGRLDTAGLDAGYWFENLRRPVDFLGAVRHLLADGYRSFVECSAHPALTANVEEIAEKAGEEVIVVGTLRRDEGGEDRFTRSLAEAHVQGVPVDWTSSGIGGRLVPLPTYAFQRERYWLPPAAASTGDLTAAGLGAAPHPLLGAALELADDGGTVLTGTLSLNSRPWLADHALGEVALLAGSAFVDLAIRAGQEAGLGTLTELTLHAPLVLPTDEDVVVQARLGPTGDDPNRALHVHARSGASAEWTLHAAGTLAPGASTGEGFPTGPVPADAEEIDLTDRYAILEAHGVHYGPAFQGLLRAWRTGDDVLAEVELPEDHAGVAGFGVHPALMDAALQTVGLLPAGAVPEGALPFAFTGVTVHAPDATALRVRTRVLDPAGRVSVTAAHRDGRPAFTIESLVVRTAAAPEAAAEALFRLDWQQVAERSANPGLVWASVGGPGPDPVTREHQDFPALTAALDDGEPVPDVVVLSLLTGPDVAMAARGGEGEQPSGVPAATHRVVHAVEEFLRGWLAEDRLEQATVVVLTGGAVAAIPGEDVPDLAGAAVWGLLRATQSEHPGRFVLVDTDDPGRPRLVETLASGEPQLAMRRGALLAPRLVRAAPATGERPAPLPAGTVLLTGGTGAVGAHLARHLAGVCGASRLLLASRSGGRPEANAALREELAELGAHAEFARCDIADRGAVEALLDGVPPEHPLVAVVHAAGVLADGLVETSEPGRTSAVLRPKVDGAVHLHELTRDRELAAFVLVSSAAGVFGSPGQSNYAAANAFLDALAHHRRAAGLPAQSLAWGTWDVDSGALGDLGQAQRERLRRLGRPLTPAEALSLFEAARADGSPLLVPVRLGRPVGEVAPLLRALVRPGSPRPAGDEGADLRSRLAGLAGAALEAVVRETVFSVIAEVLGHSGPGDVVGDRGFLELGLDSLTVVELRNTLTRVTGLRLKTTLVFDSGSPDELVRRLAALLTRFAGPGPVAEPTPAPAENPLDGLDALFRYSLSLGRRKTGQRLVREAAKLRPMAESPADWAAPPVPLRLADGPRQPTLVCFASIVAIAGAHQFARFAGQFRDIRSCLAFDIPGFRAGELLSADVETLAGAYADAIIEQVPGPCVLLGSSSGGYVAHATASALEARGVRPAGVALLDTYLIGDPAIMNDRVQEFLMGGMFEREDHYVRMDGDRLTAMAWYSGMFEDWTPGKSSAPLLLVRASEPMDGMTDDPASDDWRASWDGADTVVDVPGNHFTIGEEHLEHSTAAVEKWLRTLEPLSEPGNAGGRRDPA
jgi:polyketide synthase 7